MNTFLQLMERTFFLNGSGPSQRDVAYQPDAEKYKSHIKRRLEKEQLPKELPEGFQLSCIRCWQRRVLISARKIR